MGAVKKNDESSAATSTEKIEALKKYFQRIYLHDNGQKLEINIPSDIFQIQNVIFTSAAVFKQLPKPKTFKAAGPVDLHPAVLKPLASVLAVPLTVLFNVSAGGLASQ